MKYIILFLIVVSHNLCFGQFTKVKRVVDGDTFVTESGERVRLIGINAPEMKDFYGIEAKEHLAELIEGRDIELTRDHKSKDRDRYSRLLRYVVLSGVDINEQMIREGYAYALLKFRFDRAAVYTDAEAEAKDQLLGMWKYTEAERNEPQNIPVTTPISNITQIDLYENRYVIGGLVIMFIILGINYRLRA
jgi:micrococcal nuclease